MLALALTLRIPQSRPSLRIVTLPLLKVPADEAERFASMVSVRDKIQQLQQDLGRVWSTLGAIRASDATPPGLALALTLTPTVPRITLIGILILAPMAQETVWPRSPSE